MLCTVCARWRSAASNASNARDWSAHEDADSPKEAWGSPLDFVIASMGAAIGLGTVVRFPYLAYRYGGGAFLIPYILANAIIGVPVLGLEFMTGQYMQAGAMQAFARAHKRMWGLGVIASYTSFVTVMYVITAFVLRPRHHTMSSHVTDTHSTITPDGSCAR